MSTLEDRIESIRHRKMDLDKASCPENHNPFRPEISVWADVDVIPSVGEPHVVLSLAATWGASVRFVNLSAAEARRLARFLTDVATAVEEAAP